MKFGIDSLKIEGRMKSVHYCATVAKVYRTAIDTYLKEGKDWYVRPEWIAELEKISIALIQMALLKGALMRRLKTMVNLQIPKAMTSSV